MSRYEIIAMATDAGLNSYRVAPGEAVEVWGRFAALVAAREREECALVCESFKQGGSATYIDDDWADMCAASIRARGKP